MQRAILPEQLQQDLAARMAADATGRSVCVQPNVAR